MWLTRPPRKLASIGVHVSRWVTTHGYALNVDLDPAPFTEWITACGLEDAMFTTIAREAGRPVTVDEVRPHAVAALEAVFGLELEELPADEGIGLWAQPVHAELAARCSDAGSQLRRTWRRRPHERGTRHAGRHREHPHVSPAATVHGARRATPTRSGALEGLARAAPRRGL